MRAWAAVWAVLAFRSARSPGVARGRRWFKESGGVLAPIGHRRDLRRWAVEPRHARGVRRQSCEVWASGRRGVAEVPGHDSHHVWEWPRLERQPTSAPGNGWADQANCFDVGRVTFDRAHLLAVAACPVDAEHVAAEKRRAVRAVQRGLPQVELCGWLTPLGSAHRPGADE